MDLHFPFGLGPALARFSAATQRQQNLTGLIDLLAMLKPTPFLSKDQGLPIKSTTFGPLLLGLLGSFESNQIMHFYFAG